MLTDLRVLDASASLQTAVEVSVASGQRDFPVVSGGRLVGVLWQENMIRGLQDLGVDTPIAEVTEQASCQAHHGERVDAVLQRLGACDERLMPVTDAFGRLVGVTTPDSMGQFLRLQAAVRR